MTIRPIIFSAPMVRALLDGRKTQTRRVLKRAPQTFLIDGKECGVGLLHVEGETVPRVLCGNVLTTQKVPYAIGDLLYVREAHYVWSAGNVDGTGRRIDYRATTPDAPCTWSSPIHMHRWASRLTLAVTGVKVEKLQDISEDDARAEGVEPLSNWSLPHGEAFARLWNSLHGHGAWDQNPWVVAITFDVHKVNVDEFVKREAA